MWNIRLSRICVALLLAILDFGRVTPQSHPDPFTPALVRQTVERVADRVQDNYFDSALAGQIADSLRRRLADGEYDILITPKSLAEKLTGELFDLTRDKHLVVSVKATTESQTGSAHANDVDRTKRGQMENFGVQRVEILNGNVGYLNLISFYRPEEAGSAIAAAMHLVRHADALIVDLRDHSGGSPDTTVLFASYFF